MKRIFISSVQKEFADVRRILKRYVSKNPAYRRHSAILLFGRDPQRWFLTSQVKCVEWPTPERCKPIKDHRIITGSLFEMTDAAVSFVLGKLEHWIGVRSDSAVAPSDYDIPRSVVLEAIVNGVAHRDYTSNASVQVELFPDRLLIMSPGKPHPSVDAAHLDKPHSSNPTNPLIADALYQTGHIERLGTGLEDLFKTCMVAGLPKPKIELLGGGFHITIFRRMRRDSHRIAIVNDAINDAIKSRPGVKKVELVRIIGKSKPTIERAIALLKQQGLIEYRGSKKTGGYYVKE